MSAQALPRDPAAPPRRRSRSVAWLDETIIQITDRAPSNRVLVSVLAISLLTLLLMALTGGKQRGAATPLDSAKTPVESVRGESPATLTPLSPAVADAPARVIDRIRREPPPQVAAETVRAEPLAPRVADAPRAEGSVGSTSPAPAENAVAFPSPVRVRDVAESIPVREDFARQPRDARPAERTSFDPSLNPGL